METLSVIEKLIALPRPSVGIDRFFRTIIH